jgi:hypothetical protein
MRPSDVSLGRFSFRITACHMVTYMVAGIAAYTIMDYPSRFAEECSIMIPTDSARVALGPALQVVRGLIFAVALFPFRRVILDEERGWLKLWGLFLGLAILSTAGPAPGSVEGLIYTRVSAVEQILGLGGRRADTRAQRSAGRVAPQAAPGVGCRHGVPDRTRGADELRRRVPTATGRAVSALARQS